MQISIYEVDDGLGDFNMNANAAFCGAEREVTKFKFTSQAPETLHDN